MALADDLATALRSAPESYQDPTLAVSAAAAGGDVQQNAEVTAHLLNTQAQQNAVNTVAVHHGGHGLFGATLGWLGGGIKGATDLVGSGLQNVMKLANAPLQEVQHQYRYLRDVESNHGFGAMLLEALPMAAGGIVGGLVAGPQGAILGAEAAGAVADRTLGRAEGYSDSWDRTHSATYVDPHGGQAISPGRDVARLLDSITSKFGLHIEQHKGFDLFDAVSAAGDGLFDLTADPLAKLGAIRHEAVGAEGARGALAAKWGGTAMKGADVVKVAAQYPSVQRGLETMASITDAGELAAKFPKFKAFSAQLAEADTWQKAGQVLVDNAEAAAMTSKVLPRATVGKMLFAPAVEALRNWSSEAALGQGLTQNLGEGRVAGAVQKAEAYAGETYKRVTTFVPTSFNRTTQELSRTTLYFNDPNAAGTILNMARWGHTEGMARALATQWAIGTLPERMLIFRNVMTDNIGNRVVAALGEGADKTPEVQDALKNIGDKIDGIFGGVDGGRTTPWGFDEEGRIISKYDSKGQTVSHPIIENQHINVPMPDYLTFDRNIKSLGAGNKLYGAVDDALYSHFTQNVFKKWVLATGGFALRVASGEILPAIYRSGSDTWEGKISSLMQKRGYTMAPGEADHVGAVVARFVAKHTTTLTDDEIGALAENVQKLGGHTVAPAVSAGHGQGQEIIGKEEYVKDSLYSLKTQVPKSVRVTDEVAAIGPEHDDAWTMWQKQTKDMAEGSPATRAAAQAYHDAMFPPEVAGEAAAPVTLPDNRTFATPNFNLPADIDAAHVDYTGHADQATRRAALAKFGDWAAGNPEYQASVQTALESLPDKITVYRGEGGGGLGGQYSNVSLRPDFAEQYAGEGGQVKSYQVNKSDVVGIGAAGNWEVILRTSDMQPAAVSVEDIANKAADAAAEKAVRRAATRTEGAAAGTGAEPAAKLSEAETAAQRAADRAARAAAEEEIPPQEPRAPRAKSEKPEAPLSPELQAVVDRARQKAYDAAHKAATQAAHEGLKTEATAAAVRAARETLDNTPEEILNQHMRHFEATSMDSRPPNGPPAPNMKWVPSEAVGPGQPSVRPHWEYEPPVSKPPLVSPVKLGPGEYEHVAPEGTYTLKKTGDTWTLTTPDRGEQEVATWGKGVEAISRRTVREPTFVPGQLEMPGGMERVLDAPPLLATPPDPHEDWARVIVENMKGTVHGADGMLHEEVLNALKEGRAPSTDYMSNVPMESRPNRILGNYEKPAAPDRLSDRIFSKLNGVINWISREPMYNAEFLKQYREFKPMMDAGILTPEEAFVRMNTRAVNQMLPQIHNINERTLMSEHVRNFIPFYFAQQQSYARLFRLLGEDPAAFRKIQLTYSNLSDFGGMYDDSSGKKQMVIPGLGFLTGGSMKGLAALGVPVINSLPQAWGGSLKSLASMSPFLEGSDVIRVGPLVAIGARALTNILPEAMGLKEGVRSVSDAVVGTQGQSQAFWQMLVPNSAMRSLIETIVPTDSRTQAKSVLDAVQSLEYQQNVAMDKWTKGGSKGDPPHITPSATATDMERQDYINRIKNTARILTFSKAIVGSLSPVAPSIQLGDYGLRTELYDAIKKDGISKAITDFLAKNPQATPYTIFETSSGVASPIQSTHPAQQWVTGNLDFIKNPKYSEAASYFVPQSNDKFNQTIYNEQMAMGLRQTKAPDKLIEDIHIGEGNRWYFDVFRPARDAALANVNNPHEKQTIMHQWQTTGGKDAQGKTIDSLDSQKALNPIWYTNFSTGGRNDMRTIAISQLQSMYANGEEPTSPMTGAIKDLLDDYAKHAAAQLPGRTDSYAASQRKTEKSHWQEYLKTKATDQPELAMIINNVFRGA